MIEWAAWMWDDRRSRASVTSRGRTGRPWPPSTGEQQSDEGEGPT